MRVTSVDCFQVKIPWPAEEIRAGKVADLHLTRIQTDEGITGWAPRGIPEYVLRDVVRPLLIGNDPFLIEHHLQRGLIKATAAEWALWDIVGKAAGLPVHKLLGGCRTEIQVYLTIVWAREKQMTPAEQVDGIIIYAEQGFHHVKVRAWRDNPYEDVDIVRGVRQRLGARDKMEVAYDRTAGLSGSVWDFDTALEVARQMEELDTAWLEEPLQHRDIESHARLAEAVDLPISGGERDRGVSSSARYCANKSFDILQPDGFLCGGISTFRKIGALAEGFGIPLYIHGTHGMGLAPYFQCAATVESCRVHEICVLAPPITPMESWEPILKIINTPELFHMEGDILTIPTLPGLGVDINADAVAEYTVPAGTPGRPGPYSK